jgi:hypothetical protein
MPLLSVLLSDFSHEQCGVLFLRALIHVCCYCYCYWGIALLRGLSRARGRASGHQSAITHTCTKFLFPISTVLGDSFTEGLISGQRQGLRTPVRHHSYMHKVFVSHFDRNGVCRPHSSMVVTNMMMMLLPHRPEVLNTCNNTGSRLNLF